MKFRKILMLFSGVMLSAPLFAQDISGFYKCKGYDPIEKKDYEQDLTVKKTNETYNLTWEETNQIFTGTGLSSKSQEDIIASLFLNPDDEKKSGVIIHKIKTDGSLEGSWTYIDQEIIGTETCKKP